MKIQKIYILTLFLLIAFSIRAQVYTHPTTGIANEYVGSCEVATCSGTYYDDGGALGSTTASGAPGNYSNNIGNSGLGAGIYRIFCPPTAGQCLRATFNVVNPASNPTATLSIEGGVGCPYERLTISNGSTQNSPSLWSGCGTGVIPGSPFTGTANGCLGFRFYSDGSVNRAGWDVTFSCVACAGAPNGTDNNDCTNATLVCAPLAVPGNSTGPGILAEACGGGGCPAGGENYSNWYSICFTTGGTFTFTISPSVASDDYDYALYGPNTGCAALGPALRCSDSGLSGNTGLSAAAGDLTEDVTGDKFTAVVNVLAGECYYLMVDEWTPTGAGYTLSFGGTATISCTPLPVELISFTAKYNYENKKVDMEWATATELNNDYFAVERSVDGVAFEQIDIVDGAGTTSQLHSYSAVDENPFPGEINYYRLRQVDFDGRLKYSDIEAVFISDFQLLLDIYPNPATESADIIFNTAYESDYHLQIYDYTAKQLVSYHFKSVKGKNKIPLNLVGFHQGVYFITLQGRGDMLKTSFIKE